MKRARRLNVSQEDGFAALIIAIVLVTVLSLITIGFAELVRHEAQNALNRQLSNAAFYAAESGVNDAAKALAVGYTSAKTSCDTSSVVLAEPGSAYLTNPVIAATNSLNTRVSCLLIDQAPFDLLFSSLGSTDDTGKAFQVTGENSNGVPTAIDSMTFSWQDESGQHNFAPAGTLGQFPPAANWTSGGGQLTGILRVELVPISGAVSRAGLTSGAYTAFLYPISSGLGTTTFASGVGTNNGGIIVSAHCRLGNTPHDCTATISGLSATQYLVRLNSLYDTSTVSVTATGAPGSTPLRLANVQALIDSTGNVAGVLRRIQVRIPSTNEYDYPQFGLEGTTGICKLLSVAPTLPDGTTTVDGCQAGGPVVGGGGGGPPPGGGPGGDAGFDTCPGGLGCPASGGGGAGPLSWFGKFVNTSNNPPSQVASCVWNFGDAAQGDPKPTATTACNLGDSLSHKFFPGTSPAPKCYTYKVTLTVVLKTGVVKNAPTQTVKMPQGTGSPC